MDIIHRLSPFHRPASALSRNTPTPFSSHTTRHGDGPRASSFLENSDWAPYPTSSEGTPHLSMDLPAGVLIEGLPRGSLPPPSHPFMPDLVDSDVGQRGSHPAPASHTAQGARSHGHSQLHRTSSILRTLTHHPSLSALKSKSTRSKRKDKRKGIPPMPAGREALEAMGLPLPVEMHGGDGWGEGEGEGKNVGVKRSGSGKLRKGSLKGSRSLPRDMRLSGDFQFEEPAPPLPSPSHYAFTQSQTSYSTATTTTTARHHSISPPHRQNTTRRKPAPTPDITVYHDCSSTPESVKVRMRFEMDWTSDHGHGGSPARRRYMSFDERASPFRSGTSAGEYSTRHMSSPPKHQMSDPPHLAYPMTTQHPHPVPLAREQTMTIQYDEPEALDMFAKEEVTPKRTPGGKKADMKRGPSVEGERSEKGAVRVFSRDLYGPPSVSPSSSNTLSPERLSPNRALHRRAESSPSPSRKSRDAFLNAAKRSSSPFEIKLSPFVTKRMSLDAFGTPVAPSFGQSGDGERVEQLANYEEEDSSEDSLRHQDSFREEDEYEEEEEEEEGEEDDVTGDHSGEGGEQDGADDKSDENPLANYRAHELSTIQGSTSSHYNSRELSASELKGFSGVPSSTPFTKSSWQPPSGKSVYYTPASPPPLSANGLPLPPSPYTPSPLLPRKYMSAPPLIGISQTLYDAHVDHSASLKEHIKAGEVMMDVLRSEVEEMKKRLQQDGREKEELAEFAEQRMAELEEVQRSCEAKDFALEQLRQAMTNNERVFDELRDERGFYEERCSDLERENDDLLNVRERDAETIAYAQGEIDDFKREVKELREKNGKLRSGKKEAESLVFDLRKELAFVESRVEELENVEEALREKEDEMGALEENHAREVAALESELKQSKQQLAERDGDVLALQDQVGRLIVQYEGRLVTSGDELRAAKQLIAERDATVASFSAEIASFTDKLTSSEASVHTVKLEIVAKDKTVDELSEKLRLVRFEANEKHFGAQEEMGKLREQVEELTRMGAEREMGSKQANEMLARYMEEKRVWDEEKEELYESLNRISGDEDTVSSLQSQVEELSYQLVDAERQIEALQDECASQKTSLEHKITLLDEQDAELAGLRHAIIDAEEAVARSQSAQDRQAKDSERTLERLREQVQELEGQLSSHDSALRSAVVEAENGKMHSADFKSRIERYLAEIDELRLAEAKLKAQVDELRRSSAMDEVKRVELEKKVGKLEQEKELLNVALDSKQMEVVLLQRKEKHRVGGTPSYSTGRPSSVGTSSMSKSTSRIPATPTPSTGIDNTPLPRRLSTSTSTTAATRPRATTASSTRVPLGASTRHNNTPPERARSGTVSVGQAGKEGVTGLGKSVVKRTSLPVLVRRPGSAIGANSAGLRESLRRVDEEARGERV
ncbi:hypothetical protein IAT38_001176 [Cryptococcus sp. DSM 104549]